MRGRFPEAMGYGVSDYVGELTLNSLLARRDADFPTRVVVGEEDACFRAGEYERVFAEIGCGYMLMRVPGQHASMFSYTGRRKLLVAGQLFGAFYKVGGRQAA